MSREICSFSDHFSAWFKKLLRHDWGKKHKKWNGKLQAVNILLMVMILLPLKILFGNALVHLSSCFGWRIRSNKKMLLLVGGLPPGPDRLPSNLVQYYDDEKKTWKILTSKWFIFVQKSMFHFRELGQRICFFFTISLSVFWDCQNIK